MAFIVMEGIDGSGKSTAFAGLCNHIRTTYPTREVVQTRELGGTPLGEDLREMVIRREMDPLTELFLVCASRAEHVRKVIQPALQRGALVLSDRFHASTYAYQIRGHERPEGPFLTLDHIACSGVQPTLTVLLDLDPKLAAQRLAAARDNPDKFETRDLAFITRTRAAYLNLTWRAPSRFAVVNANASESDVLAEVIKVVTERVGHLLAPKQESPK